MAFLGDIGDVRSEGQTLTLLFFDDGLVLLRGAGAPGRPGGGSAVVGEFLGNTMAAAVEGRRRQTLAGLGGGDDASTFAAGRRHARLILWPDVSELRLATGPRGSRQITVRRTHGGPVRLAGRATDLDAARLRALVGPALGDRLVVTVGE